MKTQLLIGIDLGSSSLKALALEAASGRTVALSRMPLQHDRLPGGGCEVGEPMLRSALSAVLRDVAHQLGRRVADVRAIGCTGHGAGLYALDARGELAGGRAVASTDQRAGGSGAASKTGWPASCAAFSMCSRASGGRFSAGLCAGARRPRWSSLTSRPAALPATLRPAAWP